jgi:hypothetical protein
VELELTGVEAAEVRVEIVAVLPRQLVTVQAAEVAEVLMQ